MKIHEYRSELLLQSPLDVVFPFFSDAVNLEALTPPWMHFQILTPRPIAMRVGALIDYRLRVRGFPIRWRSEITVWQPSLLFVDEQRRGPYRLWKHEHRFEEFNGGTRALDIVHYAVPFDFFPTASSSNPISSASSHSEPKRSSSASAESSKAPRSISSRPSSPLRPTFSPLRSVRAQTGAHRPHPARRRHTNSPSPASFPAFLLSSFTKILLRSFR
jgi:ligand-binding SRPBCC domain-containing protein